MLTPHVLQSEPVPCRVRLGLVAEAVAEIRVQVSCPVSHRHRRELDSTGRRTVAWLSHAACITNLPVGIQRCQYKAIRLPHFRGTVNL